MEPSKKARQLRMNMRMVSYPSRLFKSMKPQSLQTRTRAKKKKEASLYMMLMAMYYPMNLGPMIKKVSSIKVRGLHIHTMTMAA